MALANAVDFDDPIGRTVELLRTDPAVAEYYHHRFRYILVDEYQDTNHAQYVLVRELAGVDTGRRPSRARRTPASPAPPDHRGGRFRPVHLRVPWRRHPQHPGLRAGLPERQDHYARTELSFDADHSGRGQRGDRQQRGPQAQKLWTALGKGEPIVGYAADNAQQEAQWVATEIARLHAEEGISYSDMAIMYRANAQSRSLEEAPINTNQPYQLVGGTKFYERREIKDALAYLQALVNPDDDVNLRRILNVPKRGLGDRAEGVLLAYAREHGTSFFYALMHLDEIEVPTRTATSLRAFRDRWARSRSSRTRTTPSPARSWPKYWRSRA